LIGSILLLLLLKALRNSGRMRIFVRR
jgi:hypothetical protein